MRHKNNYSRNMYDTDDNNDNNDKIRVKSS